MKCKIISRLGNKIIVSVPRDSAKTLDLKTVKGIYDKTVSVDNSNIGKIFDIIGRTESPYIVIKLFRGKDSNLVGKSVSI